MRFYVRKIPRKLLFCTMFSARLIAFTPTLIYNGKNPVKREKRERICYEKNDELTAGAFDAADHSARYRVGRGGRRSDEQRGRSLA